MTSKNAEELDLGDIFNFDCDSGLECFTQCCQNVNILLTPYEIIQMKNRLGLSSTEFLKRYTKTLVAPETSLPAVQLKMDEENGKRCFFVSDDGCEIYSHRPWACRMYPLDRNSQGEGFVPLVDSSRCLGLKDEKGWLLREWFDSQGLKPYETWNNRFAEITEDQTITTWRKEYPGGFEIFYLACYDLDRFREVVFKENLYEMVSQSHLDLDKLRTNDLALLEFAFNWLKCAAKGKVDDEKCGGQ